MADTTVDPSEVPSEPGAPDPAPGPPLPGPPAPGPTVPQPPAQPWPDPDLPPSSPPMEPWPQEPGMRHQFALRATLRRSRRAGRFGVRLPGSPLVHVPR